ncbi:MAG: iron ABC transporter permease [Actinobacteria bacterium]|nr:iron ABC transporter permease [Actinomycetota bacterium]
MLLFGGLVLLILRPVGELFSVALSELGTARNALDQATAGNAALNSLVIAVAVGLIASAVGLFAALLTERGNLMGRRALRIGILLPLIVPPFVSALAWSRVYGPSGLTDDLVGWSLPGLFGPLGIILVIAVNALPIAYLIIVGALNSSATPDLERAARASGASSWRASVSITIPLLFPALAGTAILTMVVALNSFGVPAILGTPARFSTVTTRIYQDLARSAQPEAFNRAVVLACGLVVVAFLLMAATEGLVGVHSNGPRTAEAAGPVVQDRRRSRPAVLAWVVIALVTVLPLLAITLVALTKAVGLAPVPANWTLENFTEALGGRFLAPLGRSVLLAAASATIALFLGGLATLIASRRLSRAVSLLVGIAFAVPGSTLAVGVLLAYGPALRDTLLLILIAYVAKLWAIGHRSVAGSVHGLSRELGWAARAAGASSLVALRTVLLPILRPALFGGWLLVFLFAFHELTMSSLLYGPGTDTLAVVILNLQQVGDVGASSALAVILTVPILVVAIPLLATRRLSAWTLGQG